MPPMMWYEAVREAVTQNMGISAVQQSEIGQDVRLHTLHISDQHVVLEEYVVFLKERQKSPIVAAFTSVVEDHLK